MLDLPKVLDVVKKIQSLLASSHIPANAQPARDLAGWSVAAWHLIASNIKNHDDLMAVFNDNVLQACGVNGGNLDPYDALRLRVAQESSKTRDPAQALALRDELAKSISAANLSAGHPDAKNLLTALNKLGANGASASAAEDELKNSGPGAKGWQFDPANSDIGGAWITYKWNNDEITFLLVTPQNGTDPFYLAQTALPAGLFINWLNDKSNNKLREDVCNGKNPAEDGLGVIVWQVNSLRADKLLKLAPAWLAHATLPDGKIRPPDSIAPETRTPVQMIGAKFAGMLADSLGCRLPSEKEWLAALEEAKTNPSPSVPNRRDQIWADYNRAFHAIPSQPLNATLPDGDIFWPDGKKGAEGKDAMAAMANSDGRVFFQPVARSDSHVFDQLEGNVAEFLYDPDTTQYSVVGASALSPPEVNPATPYPVKDVEKPFADVGLRISFKAPRQTLAGILKAFPNAGTAPH
jgi:hypothetical protein